MGYIFTAEERIEEIRKLVATDKRIHRELMDLADICKRRR